MGGLALVLVYFNGPGLGFASEELASLNRFCRLKADWSHGVSDWSCLFLQKSQVTRLKRMDGCISCSEHALNSHRCSF